MAIVLENTNSAAIAEAMVGARRRAGSPAMGMVLSLIVAVDEAHCDAALQAARSASKEHPSRVIAVIHGRRSGPSRVDAEIQIGDVPGESITVRLSGEVVDHAASVVLPLLLPDSPVVIWWPTRAPESPGLDPLGRLAQRRITDAASEPRRKGDALRRVCGNFTEGDTDLSWTRLTGWRALLAAALDQHPGKVTAAEVTAERVSPSADLLVVWLADRLRVEVARKTSKGPGITSVVMETREGEIALNRPDGLLAHLSGPGQPTRPVALKRREIDELLAEEMRRLDNDDVFERIAGELVAASGDQG